MFPGGGHSTECDARTEAIQQAREEGAAWAIAECVDWCDVCAMDDGTAQKIAAKIKANVMPGDVRIEAT
jgi:hypothetical protein